MPVLIDNPRHVHRIGQCAHLFSALSEQSGTDELIAFGHRIGLKKEWLQNPSRITEHFDVMRSKIRIALKAGVQEVTHHELAAIFKAKRQAADQLNEILGNSECTGPFIDR